MEQQQHEDPSWLHAFELATMGALPMALKAAIQLNIFQIISDHHHGHTVMLSPQQILSHIPSPHVSLSPQHLNRILRLLASHSLLSSSLHHDDHALPFTKYGLTPTSAFFLNDEHGFSLAPFLLLNESAPFSAIKHHIQEAVLDGEQPFHKAHSKTLFDMTHDDTEFNSLFNSAMHGHSALVMKALLRLYDGFSSTNCLVDVGGGTGSCLKMILKKYPHIRGINFDRPHVIKTASPYPGMEHVVGDMFESIPSGDAIFMKWILHDWPDQECVKILEKCKQALPQNGKVIVVDAVLPEDVKRDVCERAMYHMDLFMFAFTPGGKERTEQQLKELGSAAGFANIQVVCRVNAVCVIEFLLI